MTTEEAKEAIKEAYGNSEYTDEIIEALEQEQKIGYWIEYNQEFVDPNRFAPVIRRIRECSNCHIKLVEMNYTRYCPSCGSNNGYRARYKIL